MSCCWGTTDWSRPLFPPVSQGYSQHAWWYAYSLPDGKASGVSPNFHGPRIPPGQSIPSSLVVELPIEQRQTKLSYCRGDIPDDPLLLCCCLRTNLCWLQMCVLEQSRRSDHLPILIFGVASKGPQHFRHTDRTSENPPRLALVLRRMKDEHALLALLETWRNILGLAPLNLALYFRGLDGGYKKRITPQGPGLYFPSTGVSPSNPTVPPKV